MGATLGEEGLINNPPIPHPPLTLAARPCGKGGAESGDFARATPKEPIRDPEECPRNQKEA